MKNWSYNKEFNFYNHISSVVDHGFEYWSGQTKDYKIDICCFYTKHTPLRRKGKDLLDKMSVWSDMSTHRLLFQWASTNRNPSKRVCLVQSGHHYHLIDNLLSITHSIFPLWTFHLYVVTFQQHLHVE